MSYSSYLAGGRCSINSV